MNQYLLRSLRSFAAISPSVLSVCSCSKRFCLLRSKIFCVQDKKVERRLAAGFQQDFWGKAECNSALRFFRAPVQLLFPDHFLAQAFGFFLTQPPTSRTLPADELVGDTLPVALAKSGIAPLHDCLTLHFASWHLNPSSARRDADDALYI
jgi:hypothetical protein